MMTWQTIIHTLATVQNTNQQKLHVDVGLPPENWNNLGDGIADNKPLRFYSVDNAGIAVGSPSKCYKYGILIVITATIDPRSRWRNVLIYIEDVGLADEAIRGKVYIRTGQHGTAWKCFDGTFAPTITA